MNKILAILLLLITFGISTAKSEPKDSNLEIWIWMHGNSEYSVTKWDSIYSKLSDHGIKGVLFGGDIEQLQKVIPIANKYNIEIHAWFWTMNRRDAKKEWLSVNRNGESLADKKAYVDYYKFMCPALPEVKEFIKQHIRDLIQVDGLKGIHMDYVRYVDVILPEAIQPTYNLVQDHEFPEYDYGYHPYMRELYKKEFGIDPIDIEDPENDQQWKQFRYDKLTEAIHEIKSITGSSEVELSAAVFPTPEIARKLVRQDWDKWPLDAVFPMIYHNFYNKETSWIQEATEQGVNSLEKNQLLYSGIYIPAIKDKMELSKAIQSAIKGGAKGIALFDYRALKEFHWELLLEYKLSKSNK